ncbi:MAG TPA: TetR/AcrR family transcriptional regulator [Solirubrobacterales bacterium]|nr:TetR/AcrR family transcriptional regulator [Solirubrobacterales bacterium]
MSSKASTSSKASADEGSHPPDELAQLPHGRHGLPAEFVDHNQRERLIASFTALIGEVGYSGATITAVTEGAGVSSRTFYKFFETVEDCCLAAFDKGVADLRPLVAEAYRSEEEWPLRIAAALAAAVGEFDELPDLARLLTTEPFVAGPLIATRHKAVLEELTPFLREGRALRDGAEPLPETTEKGLLGAVNSMISRHVAGTAKPDLGALLPDLVQFVLTPYLGPAEARRIAVSG